MNRTDKIFGFAALVNVFAYVLATIFFFSASPYFMPTITFVLVYSVILLILMAIVPEHPEVESDDDHP